MKKCITLSLLVFLVFIAMSCKSKKQQVNPDGSVTTVEDTPETAVCIWDKISLKDSPSDKGKWLASMSLGEKCVYLDETKEDNSGKKPVNYIKVQLQDKQEGWVQADFVIVKSKAATIVNNAEIYLRPDLLTKAGKSFNPMDIVAIKSEQGDFLEVVGKRKTGKWIENGWIKSGNVSYADVDIAVAKFGCKAMEIGDRQKRNAALNEIINNADYKSSVFINTLFRMVDDSLSTAKPAPVEGQE